MSQATFPIACIIMASGIARRFGSNKLLAPVNGKPMIKHILQITHMLFRERIVVTRHPDIRIICKQLKVDCILHNEPYLSDTVRLGAAYAEKKNIQGLLFAASDQPLLTQATLIKLCQSFVREPDKIHRLYYHAAPGNPIIFPLALAAELQHLPKDKGGSILAKKYPELVVHVQAQDKSELFDVDTQADAQLITTFTKDAT